MNADQWQKSCEYAKNLYTKIDISDTICKATDERQQEAAELSARCEAMIVIGGRSSSNTRRLFEAVSYTHLSDRRILGSSGSNLCEADRAAKSVRGSKNIV